MASRFFQQGRNTVNLIFSDHVIRFLELKQHSPLVVQQWGERYFDQELIKDGRILDRKSLAFILENCIEEWGIKKKNVRFIVPDQTIAIRKITVPPDVNDDEIKGYLFLEIGTSIHLPFENPLFDVFLVSKTNAGKEVLLVATEEEVVESYVSLLEELKLNPVAADISPLAFYRLMHLRDYIREEEHVMILQFDHSLLTISIFYQDILVFMRPVPLDGAQTIPDTSALSSFDLESNLLFEFEDLFKVIEQILSFYQFTLNQGSAQVRRFIMSGDHPDMEHIQRRLEQRLDAGIQRIFLEDIKSQDGTIVPDSFSTILGLALKEV
ncbi:type IV pilus biogenesis protein PilM [Heyndrickxia acidicola]|uniref:Pilus assembly protein PilM n=1 Tax=Heyndrickxia acidicola TaxID=209389 RepID=A0ABU6MJF4_9BACI|nr:pilus assembly protein PilM [Heyndrickxia acidicola]MED1204799.1 pilus assembly protein PilM [Heyndrickxia acidicola]